MKRFKSRFGWTLAPFALWMASSQPSMAKDISAESAAGSTTSIAVEIGIGHTIDFSQTGEQVFRGWIGDGGRCLTLSGSSPIEEGASTVNLRRITPCQNVAGLPEVNKTKLTLMTLTPAGETKIYEFSIDYGAEASNSLTRLLPAAALAQEQPRQIVRRTLDPTAVETGVNSFNLSADSPVVSKVVRWRQAVDAGANQQKAAQSAQVDWALLERLDEVGRGIALSEDQISI